MTGVVSARDLGPDDFVWDYFCRGHEDTMADRVYAAAGAGYSAVGIYLTAWDRMRNNPSEIEVFEQALLDTGLALANIETLRGWASPNYPSEHCLESESAAWEIADRFKCRYVQVIGNYTGTIEEAAEGWNAPKSKTWLLDAIEKASKEYFNQMPCTIGEGGTIPFMAMLGKQFPEAQFVITGVLGPQSNAHGPNEFLHIPFAKNLTCCISSIITDFQKY